MSTRATRAAGEPDFGILLNLAFGAFKEALHAQLAAQGFDDLGGSFGYVLRTLEPHAEGLSLKDLAAALGVTPQGTLKIVDDMVEKGYVARRPDAHDARVKRLCLARRGQALLAAARAFHHRFEAGLAARHGAEAAAATRRVLGSLVEPTAPGAAVRMQLL